MAAATPGVQGLFGAPQLALDRADGERVPVKRELKDHLCAFACLAAGVGRRPTHLAEFVPQDLSCLGATDAAKAGMGGVCHNAEGNTCRGVWRVAFSPEVQEKLVSADNPTGTITNSDLKHTGMLAQVSTIAGCHPVRHRTMATFVDNTPAESHLLKKAVAAGAHPPSSASLLLNTNASTAAATWPSASRGRPT